MKSAKFEEDFINKILKSKEGTSLDFKQKISSKTKIAKTIAAMANTKGGILIIGLSDNRRITGIDPAEEKYMIESANEIYCHPKVELNFEEIQMDSSFVIPNEPTEKSLLLVTIAKAIEGPVKVPDKSGILQTYIRKGDRTVLIT